MKPLTSLLSAITVEEIIGRKDVMISSVECDSRKIKLGSLFVAVRGTNVDGHRFIPIVAVGGVAAIVCEELPERLESGITYIKVSDSSVALGFLASRWYDDPSRKLCLVGVTGTNGKTTTATLLYEMARLNGFKAGLLSTVCNYVDTEAVPAAQTTPDPLTLNALLARMVDAGCKYAAMEVSSHAAHQHRIAGLHFAGGVFSNLTRDHLDYHKTVDAYLQAKKSFFDNLPDSAFSLTNIDDKVGEVMLQNTRARRYTYSLRQPADFSGKIIESRLDGTLMSFNGNEVEVLFTGKFNAYNLTAVYGASVLMGFEPEKVLVDMSRLVPVAGHFQTFRSASGSRIITVVGAGGNRDKGKRPIMAREAALRSDRVILTSDNPRDEEPAEILHDMEAGLDDTTRPSVLSIVDRREAIRTAVALAAPGDVVLIAGKGHEDYQEIKGVKHHFDDREVVAEVLKSV